MRKEKIEVTIWEKDDRVFTPEGSGTILKTEIYGEPIEIQLDNTHTDNQIPTFMHRDHLIELSFKIGDQITYVPEHAHGNTNHHDCEKGFITSVVNGYAFCRYWRKDNIMELRTTSTSERTPVSNLVKGHHRAQNEVDKLIKKMYPHI